MDKVHNLKKTNLIIEENTSSDRQVDKLWSQVLEQIKEELPFQSFQTWFGLTRIKTITDDSITVEVPNKFYKEWILDHYSEPLQRAVYNILHQDIKIIFTIGLNEEKLLSSEHNPQKTSYFAKKNIKNISSKITTLPKPINKPGVYLNPKFTFEDFVIGPSNRFAHAASLAVAQSPAKAYNPLFIHGGVGLGKTHLMQAIGNYIVKKKPTAEISYVSSESFTNQLINAIQNRTTIRFREKYRNVDILLVDDIQFIAGKESTQEEFFHTFNALYDAHKQIVISSDRSPKHIPTLEERLVSRFEWGLVTDIQPPDIETRIAILHKKAEREAINVPDEVLNFIAEKITSNIRELEGALIRIVAYSSFIGQQINMDIAKETLKDMIAEEAKLITIERIQKQTADFFNINFSDMKSKKRTHSIAYPRQIAMYLSRELTDHSLPEIGEDFGGRDHTTIMHAYTKIQRSLTENRSVENIINKLINSIKS